MGILNKLFGKQNSSNLRDNLSQRDDMIRMYDNDGNEFFISKSEYRNKILPDTFEKTKDNPDGLYDAIVLTLQDGFFEDCLLPAKRLAQIDPNKERSATILGITLMKNNQLDEAQKVLDNYLEQNGDSGVVLTNLAKVFAEKGQGEKSVGTLWKALTINPNQDNALDWWGAIHHEQEGEEGFYRAMEEVAQIPGSWRPQLWLARRLLEQKKISPAIAIYRTVLESAPEAEDALMMISGDLGNNGYLMQMLDLVLPFYKAEKHGALAGLNLIQSCIRLGEKETGLRLCDSVDRLQRYDIKQYSEQLRTQLEKL
jgi:tetratricopeptide (TPR) repeat protein